MTEKGASIEAIPADVCRRICTGQVVSTLNAACKELIDNALDAGANNLEVRIRSFGTESMEVLDNGCGIHSSDFEALCKAHATSKLADLSDFSRLSTFGFRGEALNALCAISSVTITTRHRDETMATRLVYDHNGCIISRESCARPIGTTVLVNNLFETLPVRRKELERTAKKEFCKLLTVVQTFALSRTDVRFSISTLSNGKRHQVLSTPGGNASIKEVLVSLFGARSDKNAVLDIVQRAPDDEVCAIYGLNADKSASVFAEIRLNGYVSSCVHGNGRSSADRQFIYFNRRPVQYPKLCRIANEVYQQYNQGQYCMLVLFIEVPPESIDVNVAPDKRSVFYEKEKELFAVVRSSLLATFEPCLGQTQSLESTARKFAFVPTADSAQTDVDDSVVNYAPIAEDETLPYGPTQPFQVILENETRIGPPTVVTYAIDKPVHPAGPHFEISDNSSCGRKRPSNEGTGRHDVSEEGGSKKRAAAKRLEQFAFTVTPHTPSSETANLGPTKIRRPNFDNILSDASRSGNGAGSAEDEHGGNMVVKGDCTPAYRHPSLGCLVESATCSEMFALPAAVDAEAMFVDEYNAPATPSSHSNIDTNQSTLSASPESSLERRTETNSSSTVMRTQQTVTFAMADLTNRMREGASQTRRASTAPGNSEDEIPSGGNVAMKMEFEKSED